MCPGCTVTSWHSHVRSTQGSVLGPLVLSSISKTFLPQLMLSQPSLPTTQCCTGRIAGGKDTPCCSLQSDLIALSGWADDQYVLYNGSKSAELPIGARRRTAVKQPPLHLADSDIPCVFNHTYLGVTLASILRWDDHIDRLGGKVAGYVHLCRTLAFRHNMHGMAIRRFFVAFIRPRLEYCSAVWWGASPALLKDVEKFQIRVARAIVRNTTLQDVSTLQQARLPNFVVAKARTLPWPSLAAFYWERSSCITGITGALCTATVYSLSSLLSFSFCFIVFVTCRPFSVKLFPSGTDCLLLSSLLRLFLPFDQQFEATLSLICSPMVSLSYFLSFLS